MLNRLDLHNFTVFEDAELKFGALNVIHGENSSGKTHLLKLAYCIASSLTARLTRSNEASPTKALLKDTLGLKLRGVFRPDKDHLGRLARRIRGVAKAEVSARFADQGELSFGFSTRSKRAISDLGAVPQGWLQQPPIFLPARELLSVYPGFVSLYETQAIPFDETWRDTCLLLGAPVARGARKTAIAALLNPLEDAIGAKAVLEGDRFFVQMRGGRVEADLVAEGYRKLVMVARLIANGSLDDKGYLFWDEPEANLNAKLVRRLAPMLIDLALGGVQVFLATHSLLLMRELEIELRSRQQSPDTQFIGLHLNEETESTSEIRVKVEQGAAIEDSGDIAALDESLSQSERYLTLEDEGLGGQQ